MSGALLFAVCTMWSSPAQPPPGPCSPTAQSVVRRHTMQNWPHDVGHVASLAIITPAAYGFSMEAGTGRWPARLIAAGTAVAAMVLKEWHDHRAVGNFSGRDIAFGIAGTGAGFYVAERINWRPHGRTEKNQR